MRLEQAGRTHLLEPLLAAHAGSVVEHDALRHPAEPFEQVLQRLARALRILPGHQLRGRDVRMREIQHEVVHARQRAPPLNVDLAEIGLRLARMPHEVHEPRGAFLRAMLVAQPGHRPGHRRQGDLRAMLVAQTLPYPSGRVTLLAPRPPVLGEPLLDQGNSLVDHRRTAPPHRRPWRQVLHFQVLADRGLAHPDLPGDRGDGIPVPSQLTNRLNFGHADHLPFQPSLIHD